MSKHDRKLIRSSTAEFLMFTGQTGEQSIKARYKHETVWLTQNLMAELFAGDIRTILDADYFERLLTEICKRRFLRSLGNLFQVFNHRVDHCICFINNDEIPIPVFEQTGNSRDILHEVYYHQLLMSTTE